MKSKIILGFIAAIGLAACDAKEIDTAFENLGSGILLTAVEGGNVITYSMGKDDPSKTRILGRSAQQNPSDDGSIMVALSPPLAKHALAVFAKSMEYMEVTVFDAHTGTANLILDGDNLFRDAHPEAEYGIDRASLTYYYPESVCWANDDQFWIRVRWERDATADGQLPYITHVKYDVPTRKAIASSAQLYSDGSTPAGYSCDESENRHYPGTSNRMSLTNGVLFIDGKETNLDQSVIVATAWFWEK